VDEKGPCHEESRTFSLEFKRQVVEELVFWEGSPAQLCRRYSFSSILAL